MKEAEGCHKLRGAANQAMIRRFPNGGTHLGKTKISLSEFIGQRGERRELKHLSSAWKRKRSDSPCSGERKGNSLKSCHVSLCALWHGGRGMFASGTYRFQVFLFNLVELFWKGRPKRVTAS